jgi:hypothetical protein
VRSRPEVKAVGSGGNEKGNDSRPYARFIDAGDGGDGERGGGNRGWKQHRRRSWSKRWAWSGRHGSGTVTDTWGVRGLS